MNLQTLIFTNNDCYKAGNTIRPQGIMVHSTGVNNPNLKRYVGPDDGKLGKNPNNNHWNRSKVSVCVHAFIGKLNDGSIATYQVLPWNRRAWHCGSGKNGTANSTHISFEICEANLTDKEYFSDVYQEAVEFCAYLCKKHKFDPLKDGVLICHSEGNKRGIASAHADVMHWFPIHGKSMDTFRADVKAQMKNNQIQPIQPTQPKEEDKKELDEEMTYHTINDVPEYARPLIQRLCDAGHIQGTGEKENGWKVLDLPESMVRTLVTLDRMGALK